MSIELLGSIATLKPLISANSVCYAQVALNFFDIG